MNNEELKKKIVAILGDSSDEWIFFTNTTVGNEYGRFWPTEKVCIDFEKIADALIAAGVGDVKEAEAEANRYEMLYKMQSRDMVLAERKVHEAEHRAERAKRVLHCLARSFAEAMCKDGDDTHYLVDGFIQDAYSQAEKELAEGNGGKKEV